MEQSFGFVLSLSQADNDILTPVITRLQHKYCNQPPFEPHLSIYHSVNHLSLSDTIKAVSRAVGPITPFSVESDGFGYESRWSRILYIKIKPNQALVDLRTKIETELRGQASKPYIPHISLMYKDELSDRDRDQITAGLNLPKSYSIHGLQIVSPGTQNNDWRDYTKWKVIYTKQFFDR